MITNLRAQNFKSWKDTGDLRLAPLTGLFGTNSSGKSSILQILLMMKQTAEHPDSQRVLKLGEDYSGDEHLYVDLRSFKDVIHAHQPSSRLSLHLAWEDSTDIQDRRMDDSKEIQFEGVLAEENRLLVVNGSRYSVNGHEFEMSGEPTLHFYALATFHPGQDFVGELAYSLQECLRSVLYLGPLRTEPRSSYLWSGSPPTGVGRRGEFAIQALLAMRGKNDRVERQVVEWLRKLNLISAMHLAPVSQNREDYEVRVKQTPVSADVLLPDVGFGVSQILPVLVLCAYAEEGSILLLEQPEMHLHPSAQSELADIIIEAVTKRKLQIIVESHSEHFLRRLQMRIAKEEFLASDAALYFCHMENGESKAKLLQLTDDGYIKNWPPDFFGNEMGDIVAMTEASIGRRRRAK